MEVQISMSHFRLNDAGAPEVLCNSLKENGEQWVHVDIFMRLYTEGKVRLKTVIRKGEGVVEIPYFYDKLKDFDHPFWNK